MKTLNVYFNEKGEQKTIHQFKREVIVDLKKKMEKLLDLKTAKKLSHNIELYRGEKSCGICGTDPLRQREMILSIFK